MNINRNNYEDYFLLYADKELSADEKNMVELFVQQNPDLEEEFIMLQQSVIKPDNTITLGDKSALFRKEPEQEGQYINQSNYEEKFLLYTDNELSVSEIEETEKFVLSNPSLQNEFTLLQQVKYEPDTSIVFPDKRLLYKKEDDSKEIPFRWKALAAAVLLGAGLWTGISYLQQDKVEPPTVSNQSTNTEKNTVKQVEQTTGNSNIDITEEEKKQPLEPVDQQKSNNKVKPPVQDVAINIQPVIKQQEVIKGPEPKKENAVIADVPKKEEPTNNLPKPGIIIQPIDKTVTTSVIESNNNNAKYASYINEEEVKSENYVFYNITAEEFRKSKVGNFLKKVKRAVERKIPFKGTGLKIGNVEIAKDQN